MKDFLFQRLSHESRLGIVASVKTLFLHEAFFFLRRLFFSDPLPSLCGSYELTLFLESLIDQHEMWKSSFATKKEKIAFASSLASTFLELLLTGKWGLLEPGSWQKELWECAFPEPTLDLIFSPKKRQTQERPIECHLFGFSYLERPLYHFLLSASKEIAVKFYLLSPTSEFWSESAQGKREESLDHPILVDLGRAGARFAAEIEESGLHTVECYTEEGVEKLSALDKLKSSLLLNEKETLPQDDSLVLFNFSSPSREIEGLYPYLGELIERGVKPSEILVMAPDISPYLPHIRGFFDGAIDYRIAGVSAQESPLFQAIELLLNLDKKRYSATAFLELLRCEGFSKKALWEEDEVEKITSFIEKMNLTFGIDQEHLTALFLSPVDDKGCWKRGFERAWRSLAKDERFSLSDSSLLADFQIVTESLFADLEPIRSRKLKTLEEWTLYLKKLLESHFAPFPEAMSAPLSKLYLASDRLLPFSYFQFLVEKSFVESHHFERESHIEAVTFGSLKALHAVPAKVIALIGLGEEALLAQGPSDLYLDKSIGSDRSRYAILEAILSAKERLILSYVGRDAKDGSERAPSPVIQSLIRHLGGIQTALHPDFSFDPIYFSKATPLVNRSPEDYKIASLLLGKGGSLEVVKREERAAPKSRRFVEIGELKRALESPLDLYYRERLGVRIKEIAFQDPDSEFILPKIKEGLLRKKMAQGSFEQAIELAQGEAMLPAGLFAEPVRRRLEREERLLLKQGAHLGRAIELVPSLRLPLRTEEALFLPPLDLKEGGPLLVGKLPRISGQSLILSESYSHKKLFTLLAEIAALSELLSSQLESSLEKVIFVREGRVKVVPWRPQNCLPPLMRLFERATREPLPLRPSFIGPILEGDLKALALAIEEEKSGGYSESFRFYARELAWQNRLQEELSAESLLEKWGPYVEELFGHMEILR